MSEILKIIFIIIGTIIGAGFASGKEIQRFFCTYGIYGLIGIIFSGVFTGVIIYKTFKILIKNNISDNKEFIEKIQGNKVLFYIINVFLLSTFYIMIAGFASFFNQEFNFNRIIISILICLILYFILTKRVEWILKINAIIVPILVFIIFFIGITKVNYNNLINMSILNNCSNNYLMLFLDSLFYSSYNSIILIPVLISIKRHLNNRNIKIISIISSVIIIFLAILIFNLVLNVNKNMEIPVLFALNKNEKLIYGICIAIAILTSAISAGIGIVNSFKDKNELTNKILIGTICFLGVPISIIGFGNLINIIYPIFGILGLFQIILIFLNNIEKKSNY